MRALFDVNVLIALLDFDHMYNAAATRWLRDNLAHGWASCPLTQNGCIRILSQPAYPNRAMATANDVALRLCDAAADPAHEFWPDDVSLLSPHAIRWDGLLSSRHLTDVYLLLLAVRHDARLVTFDQGIPLNVVPDAQIRHLYVIPPQIH